MTHLMISLRPPGRALLLTLLFLMAHTYEGAAQTGRPGAPPTQQGQPPATSQGQQPPRQRQDVGPQGQQPAQQGQQPARGQRATAAGGTARRDTANAIKPRTTQWAIEVVDYSSQHRKDRYAAGELTGPPNVGPMGGDNLHAWQPREGNKETATVRFERPMRIRQVLIHESWNPGSVTEVVAIEPGGRQRSLKKLKAGALPVKTRMLAVNAMPNGDMSDYEVAQVRIVVNTEATPGTQQIDCIGITDDPRPHSVIRLAPDLDVQARPERLPAVINTEYAEIGPIITSDGRRLYFSRRNHPENVGGRDDREDIWYSDRASMSAPWQAARNIGTPLNNESYNFVSTVLPDNTTILVGNHYLPNNRMGAGASVSYRTAQGWADPVPQVINRENNRGERVNYFLGSSGQVLLIAADRPDGKGDRDLYVSFHRGDNEWSEPESLGDAINTRFDDYAPFLAADERTLYFSTAGWPGYGQSDIFVTRRIGDGWRDWTPPENLGAPINTPGEDAYFTLPARGDFAYYASAPDLKNLDNLDIYRVLLPASQRPRPVALVEGRVLDAVSGQPVQGAIFYEDLATGRDVGQARTGPNGEYQIALPTGRNYGYRAVADGYFSISNNLDLRQLREYQDVRKDLRIARRQVGAVVRLNNLFFDFNKAELRPESFPELNRLQQILARDKTIEITIEGHTDSIGTAKVNQTLSEARAGAVEAYLRERGAEMSRIQTAGFGRRRPVAPNETDEGRQLNRRVEFVVRRL